MRPLLLGSRRRGNLLGVLLCAAMLAFAFYSQYMLHLEPCPLCMFQRVAVVGVGIAFLAAALHDPAAMGARIYGVLIAAIALVGIGVAIRHVWIQAQPPGTVAACGAGLSYMMQVLPITEVIAKVLKGSGECSKVDWTFLGLSMPWWVLIALSLLALWAVIVNFSAGLIRPNPDR